jgi:hypothetical protein
MPNKILKYTIVPTFIFQLYRLEWVLLGGVMFDTRIYGSRAGGKIRSEYMVMKF